MDAIKAVDSFVVPNGCRGEGARERSFVYSRGVYVVPLDKDDERHKYFCFADGTYRENNVVVVPCKGGDMLHSCIRSIVCLESGTTRVLPV